MGAAVTRTAQRVWAALERESADPLENFDQSTLAGLPEPARRWLAATIPHGAPLATAVELTMTGHIKLGMWLPFTAREILRAGTGYVWAPEVGGRLLRFVGSDTLGPGGARMRFRFHDRIPVVNASGSDVDRSAAGRLAVETAAWLPHALTPQAGATWKPLDHHRATVVLPGPSGPVDVDVSVDDQGALTEVGLQRWNASAKPPDAEPFGGMISSVFDVHGVRIAGAGTVGWDHGLPAQDKGVFFDYRITSARFLPESSQS